MPMRVFSLYIILYTYLHMKNIVLLVGAVVVIGVGYYTISPLFKNIEVNDAAPVALPTTQEQEAPHEMPEVQERPSDAEMSPVESGVEALSPEEQVRMGEEMVEVNNEEASMMDEAMPPMEFTIPKEEEEVVVTEPVRHPIMGTIGHPAEGTVQVIPTMEGLVARFENFSTINGPRLHLYLATDLRATDFIDLGPIKGTRGNINYPLPDDVDLSKYKYLMHWCVPFRVLFNYAELE